MDDLNGFSKQRAEAPGGTAVARHALRLNGRKNPSREALMTLEEADIPHAGKRS